MYLKELEIFGFKSFPEKTVLKFEPGITVVVGPNGCGKSNIFDCIKWALGEQSPKSLRGTKMEDIIFNGTEHHPPLNYTEVTLTFCNEDRYLAIDYREVAITRRLYRSGESQYFINKNVARLKDIQELFMGTGVGEATYSFIEQGKIEIFLSYKPEDKRLIFDEASGIVKYKERKKETLRRLEEAEENLLRLDDILAEVKRQIRYLENQVQKAKKYKEIQSQLLEVEKKIATLKILDLEKKINSLLGGLSLLKEQEQQKDQQLKEVSERWETLQAKLKDLRSQLQKATTNIVSLEAQIENSRSYIAIDKQRIEELTERNKHLQMSEADLAQRLHLQEERIQAELERTKNIQINIQVLDQRIETFSREKDTLKRNIDLNTKRNEEQKVKILDLENKKSQLHNVLIEIQTNLSGLSNRRKRLLLDKAKLETLFAENSQRLSQAKEAYQLAKEDLESLESKRDTLINRQKQVIFSIEQTRNRLVDKEKELIELNASYEFLKDLNIKYEAFSTKKKITVIFDEEPRDINKLIASISNVEFKKDGNVYKAQIEAKVISFQEQQLQDRITIVKTEIEEISSQLGSFEQNKEKLNQQLSREATQLEEEKKKLQDARGVKESCQREVKRLEEEKELFQQEIKTTFDEIGDCQKKQTAITEEIDACQVSLEIANQEFSQTQKNIKEASERINEIDIEIARSHTERQALDKERETLDSNLRLFEGEMNSLQINLEQVDKERQENIERISSFGREIAELDEKITKNTVAISEHRRKRQSLEKDEFSLASEINATKELQQKLDKENQELKTSIYNKKLEIQSLEHEKEKVSDYIKQVYNIEFDPSSCQVDKEDMQNLCFNKEKLQKRIQSLGEVNLVAIEEFQELKKRQEFLESQKQDLVTSKEDLKKAIAKINRTSKELFLDTFTKIEQEFKHHFRFLFNGGRANLILLDKDNILESGVEIEVQPPGKKLQNVSLLSGGEKALTAIALIFAIFKVRPSPLCVLDEIDAPLDEANVDRFNHLLKKFAASSQYILITHNKKTMSNADVLYGVTMQEKGISKLVSVKFAEETEAAPTA